MKGPGVLLLLLVFLGGGAGLVSAMPAEDGEISVESEMEEGFLHHMSMYVRWIQKNNPSFFDGVFAGRRNATTEVPTSDLVNTTATLQTSATEESNSTAREVSPDSLLVTSSGTPTPGPHSLLGNSSGTPTPEPHSLLGNSSDTPTPEPHGLLVTSSDTPTPEPHGLLVTSTGTPTPEPHSLLGNSSDTPTPDPHCHLVTSSYITTPEQHCLAGNSSDTPTPEPHGLLGNSSDTPTPKDIEELKVVAQDTDRLGTLKRELEAKATAIDDEEPYARLLTRLREVFSTIWPYLPVAVFVIALVSCIVVCLRNRKKSKRCKLVHDPEDTSYADSKVVICRAWEGEGARM